MRDKRELVSDPFEERAEWGEHHHHEEPDTYCPHCMVGLHKHPNAGFAGNVNIVEVRDDGAVGHEVCPYCHNVMRAWWEHPPRDVQREADKMDRNIRFP